MIVEPTDRTIGIYFSSLDAAGAENEHKQLPKAFFSSGGRLISQGLFLKKSGSVF